MQGRKQTGANEGSTHPNVYTISNAYMVADIINPRIILTQGVYNGRPVTLYQFGIDAQYGYQDGGETDMWMTLYDRDGNIILQDYIFIDNYMVSECYGTGFTTQPALPFKSGATNVYHDFGNRVHRIEVTFANYGYVGAC
jgi:hypothetical protein